MVALTQWYIFYDKRKTRPLENKKKSEIVTVCHYVYVSTKKM